MFLEQEDLLLLRLQFILGIGIVIELVRSTCTCWNCLLLGQLLLLLLGSPAFPLRQSVTQLLRRGHRTFSCTDNFIQRISFGVWPQIQALLDNGHDLLCTGARIKVHLLQLSIQKLDSRSAGMSPRRAGNLLTGGRPFPPASLHSPHEAFQRELRELAFLGYNVHSAVFEVSVEIMQNMFLRWQHQRTEQSQ